jgi:hypothetical protein
MLRRESAAIHSIDSHHMKVVQKRVNTELNIPALHAGNFLVVLLDLSKQFLTLLLWRIECGGGDLGLQRLVLLLLRAHLVLQDSGLLRA